MRKYFKKSEISQQNTNLYGCSLLVFFYNFAICRVKAVIEKGTMKNILPRENGRCSNQLVSLLFTSASFSNSLVQAISIALALSAACSLNLSSQFKLGRAVLVAALNSVLNVPSLSLGTLSNNKRFQCAFASSPDRCYAAPV